MKEKCPACNRNFAVVIENKTLAVWCGNGKCPSKVGDKGVQADVAWTEANESKLALELHAKIEKEMESNED